MKTKVALGIASVTAVGCAIAVPASGAFAGGFSNAGVHRASVHAAASRVNGTISRSEVVSRASYWLKTQPPYSESDYAPGPDGKEYRQDCSGSVSMAWHLDQSYVTWDFNPHSNQFKGFDHQIAWKDLQPGDALVRDDSQYDHMALFVGWADSAHTKPIVIEQYDYGHSQSRRTWNSSYAHAFTPIRYNRISGSGGGPTPPPTNGGGKYYASVWKQAPSYRKASTASRAGHLNKGRNYFYCQAKGSEVRAAGYHNYWWLKTDDDSGNRNVWVNAVYISSGANDGRIPGVPVCAASKPKPKPSPTKKIYKNVWSRAGSYGTPTSGRRVGVLNTGRNYFYCQAKGSEVSVDGYRNHWWLKTDDDSGHRNVWVSAVRVSGGVNDGTIPGVPAC